MPKKSYEELMEEVKVLRGKVEQKEIETKNYLGRLEKVEKQLGEKTAQISPESGPGPACQAYKIHMGEAWQLTKVEGEDRYRPIPVGFVIRERDMMKFIVKPEMKNDEFISNCRSMYTEKYEYKGHRRPGQQDYPIYEAHLCKKHANVLLGKETDTLENAVK